MNAQSMPIWCCRLSHWHFKAVLSTTQHNETVWLKIMLRNSTVAGCLPAALPPRLKADYQLVAAGHCTLQHVAVDDFVSESHLCTKRWPTEGCERRLTYLDKSAPSIRFWQAMLLAAAWGDGGWHATSASVKSIDLFSVDITTKHMTNERYSN